MWQKLWTFIPTGSVTLGTLTLGSYMLGLLRDRIFAQTYGASRALDAYNAAFLVPDFIFNFLVASGIAAAFIPIVTQLRGQNQKEVHQYVNTVLTSAVSVMVGVAIILIIFAEPASTLVTPGFSAADQQLVAKLLRILALPPIIFAASNALGALLVSDQRFFFYGLSPLLYNLGIIGGTYLLAPQLGIMGTAIGTVTGAFLHLGARFFDASRSGVVWRPELQLRTRAFRQTLRLMLPKMFGHPVELATFWGFTAIASLLTPGSITVLNFARNFQSVPVSLLGISISTAAFPILARAASAKDRPEFMRTLYKALWLIIGSGTLAALVMFAVRRPLIALLLGGGAFSAEDIERTALTLGVFTLAIPTEALMHLLARSFYAMQNTMIPVTVSLTGLAIALGAGLALSPQLGILALPLSFFFASLLRVATLWILLPRYIRKL